MQRRKANGKSHRRNAPGQPRKSVHAYAIVPNPREGTCAPGWKPDAKEELRGESRRTEASSEAICPSRFVSISRPASRKNRLAAERKEWIRTGNSDQARRDDR